MFGPRNSTYAVNLTYDRHTLYISREISIEHPSVGLASLAQLIVTKRKEKQIEYPLVFLVRKAEEIGKKLRNACAKQAISRILTYEVEETLYEPRKN